MPLEESAIWPLTPHTAAKHRILRGYLDAYFPILTKSHREPVRYVDAFAGPGSYSAGEDGSPIIAMRSAIEHRDDFRAPVTMYFMEAVAERCDLLRRKVESIAPNGSARNVRVAAIENSTAEDGIDHLLAAHERLGKPFGPALFFLDQFGYADVPMELIARIMRNREPNCEVFSYLHVPGLKRFITDEVKDAARTRAFGDDTWKQARALPMERRLSKLVELYRAALKNHAKPKYVWHFLMAERNDEPVYWLFFCTHHVRGLEEMKKSMMRVDPTLRYRFSDRDKGKQIDFFTADEKWLTDYLSRVFSGRRVTLGDVEHHVLEHTPLAKCRRVLLSMRKNGLVRGGDTRSLGGEKTVLTFAKHQGSLL